MNNFVLLAAVGAIGYYLIKQNQDLANRLDDAEGRLTNAEDDILSNTETVNSSGLTSGNNSVIARNFRRTMSAELRMDYCGRKHHINGLFDLLFTNDSDYIYIINKIKATLFVGGYEVDCFIPGCKLPKQLNAHSKYELKAEWQDERWFSSNEVCDAVESEILNGDGKKVSNTANTISYDAYKKMCTCDIAMEVQLKGSDTTIVTLTDVPVGLIYYKDVMHWSQISGGNVLIWSEEEAEF